MNAQITRMLAVVMAAAVVAACGGTDDTTDAGVAPSSPTTESTSESTVGETASPGDTGGSPDDTSQLAAVVLTLDGKRATLMAACNGVDGAVLATTQGEVTVTLVREEGTALRYNGEGMIAETSDVEVEEIGSSTVYRATLESDEVPAVEVAFEINDVSTLDDCEG